MITPKINKQKLIYLFWISIFILIISRAFLLEHIATKALYDFDEARYAEVAKNILKTDNWIIPLAGGPDEPKSLPIHTLGNGEQLYPYFWKPPLSTQIMAIGMKVIGINELGTRLPSLLATLISLFLIFKIVKELFPQFKFAPYLTILIFASMDNLSFLSSQGLTEMPMLAFGLASIYFALQKSTKNTILAGVFFGLAFLTKSFITFWIPILCLVILWQGFHKLTFKQWFYFMASAILVILPWHIYMYVIFKSVFIDRYLIVNVLGRMEGTTGNIAPVKWYLIYMLDQWKPYIFTLPVFGSLIAASVFKNFKPHGLLLFWMGLILIPLSLASSKVFWYIFPVFIPTAILIATSLEAAYKQKRYMILALAFLSTLVSLHPFWQLNLRHTPIKEFTIFFVFMSFISFLLTQKTKKSVALLLIACVILIVGFGLKHNLQAGQARQDDNLAIKSILLRNKPKANLAVLNMAYESPLFYSDTGNIEISVLPTTKYILTKNSDLVSIWRKDFQLIDQEKEVVLFQRKE